MEILDSEAPGQNLIWNAAGDYHFEPDFKAYDDEGRADLYWNSIIGAVRKTTVPRPLMPSLRPSGCRDRALYEQLVWLGLENAVYQRDAPRRLALPALRRYARVVTASAPGIGGSCCPGWKRSLPPRLWAKGPRYDEGGPETAGLSEFSGTGRAGTLSGCTGFPPDHFGFVPGKTPAQGGRGPQTPPLVLFGRSRALDACLGADFWLRLWRASGGRTGRRSNAEPVQRRLTDRNLAQTEEAAQLHAGLLRCAAALRGGTADAGAVPLHRRAQKLPPLLHPGRR